MKIVIVGATGYVGAPLYETMLKNFEVIGTSSSGQFGLARLDLKDPENFDYSLIDSGDIVVITAAISAPDVCASRYDYAYQVNVTGTSEFIAKVIQRGGKILYFSSDTVYGGSETPLTETSPCRPVGEYGLMKHELERLFIGDSSFKAIRLSYIFSRNDKFSKYLSNCALEGASADIFHPFFRSAIHIDDVIAGVCALTREWDRFNYPVINFGGPEMVSRKMIAENLKALALPSLQYNITEPSQDFFLRRPRYINMQSDFLPIILGGATHTIKQAIIVDYKRSVKT